MKTTTQQLVRRMLEPHFLQYLDERDYVINYVAPVKLLTHNRLDLAIKELFLRMRVYSDVSFARSMYVNHIRAFTLGKFTEPGNSRKNSIEKYISEFEATYNSMTISGFQESKGLVPCSRSGSISNGAHRVASALMSDTEVPTVMLDMPDDQYGYEFFLERGLSRTEIEAAVSRFVEIAENCYTAIIWPIAHGKMDSIKKLIPNIIYETSVSLTYKGAKNLVSQVYIGEAWLGSREQNFPGASSKAAECFGSVGDLRIVVFQAQSLEQARNIKDGVRELFQIGKHSIHINDTKKEAVRICRLLLNANSVHFLNHGEPSRYASTIEKIGIIEKVARTLAATEQDNLAIDSGLVMAIYGIREAADIDYFCAHDIEDPDGELSCHDDEIKYHGVCKNELIFNPKYHFYYEDMKWIALHQVKAMKERRGNLKDRHDVVLISRKVGSQRREGVVAMMLRRWQFFRTKEYPSVIGTLRATGLYGPVRFIYRAVTRKRAGK